MARSVSSLLQRISTLVLFLTLLLVLPVVLWRVVGSPLPETRFQLSEVTDVVRGRSPVPAMVVVKIAAVLVWVFWAQFVYATLLEVVGLRRGRLSARASLVPGIQRLVSSAVFTITLLVGGLGRPALAAADLGAASQTHLISPEASTTSAQPKPTESAPQPKRIYTVKPGDSWWSIAEQELGSGGRWQDVRTYNLGRSFDGTQVSSSAEFLGEGWELWIPGGPSPSPDAPTVVVKQGDSLSRIVARNLEQDGQNVRPEQIAAGVVLIAEHNSLSDPDLLHPGQLLKIPESFRTAVDEDRNNGGPSGPVTPSERPPADSSTDPDKPSAGAGENLDEGRAHSGSRGGSVPQVGDRGDSKPASVRAMPPADPAASPETDENSGDSVAHGENNGSNQRQVLGLGLVAVAFLGSALARTLHHRQKEAGRNRSLETMLPERPKLLPSPTPRERADNTFTASQHYKDVEFLDLALKLLGQEMAVFEKNPSIESIVVSDQDVEFSFTQTAQKPPLPAGFRVVENGWSFRRPKDLQALRLKAGDAVAPLPAVLSLGKVEDGRSLVIDVENTGGVNIEASDPQLVQEVMSSMALELAASTVATTMRVVLIGFAAEDRDRLANFGRVEHHDELTPDVVARLASPKDSPGRDPVLGRLTAEDVSQWDPTVALSPRLDLADTIAQIPGVTGIVHGSKNSDLWSLKVEEGTFWCPSLPRFGYVDRPAFSEEDWQVFWRRYARPRFTSRESVPETKHATLHAVRSEADPRESSIGDQETGPESVKSPERDQTDRLTNLVAETEKRRTRLHSLPSPELRESSQATGLPQKTTRGVADVSKLDSATLEVSVLGPILVAGFGLEGKKPWKYQKTPELVTLLATSDRGRSGDALRELLWPGETDPKKLRARLNNVVSEARQGVLARPEGGSFLPHLADGSRIYELSDEVLTDLSRFERYLNDAQGSKDDTTKIRLLTSALQLVRGRPFTTPIGSMGFGWCESLREWAVVAIENAAYRLVLLQVSAGDKRLALDAAKRGLCTGTGNYSLLTLQGELALGLGDDNEVVQTLLEVDRPAKEFAADPEEAEPVLPEDLAAIRAELVKYMRRRRAM